MELITIQAKKVKSIRDGFKGIQTEFYKDNKLFCVIPMSQRQPRKDKKTITLNCWKWAIEWIN